jgi:hypothetical protein
MLFPVGEIVRTSFRVPWADRLVPVMSPDRRGVVVASLLPPGYDCYVRVFHPFVTWEVEFGRAARTYSWGSLARAAGVAFGPTLTWRQLGSVLPLAPDGSGRPWAVWEGELELNAADALFGVLATESSPGEAFNFGFELSSFGGPGPVLYRSATLHDHESVVAVARADGVGAWSPEYVWPDDEQWIVRTDWDLTSTYVAAPRSAATRLLNDPRLETVEVSLRTRVDDSADEDSEPA